MEKNGAYYIQKAVVKKSKENFYDCFINKDVEWMGFSYKYTFGALLCEFIVAEFGKEVFLKILKSDTRS